MALTNAEKQAAWRERRNALAKKAEAAERKLQELKGKAPGPARDKLAEKLEPLFEALFSQGTAHAATFSPGTVMHAAVMIERLLVEAGVMPGSRRSSDSIAYARSVRAKRAREVDAVFDTSSRRHEEMLAKREAEKERDRELDAELRR